MPGFRRVRSGKGFSYRRTSGEPITDRRVLARIKAIAIPPAWTDVWICPYANGHVQATGRDARKRKQYRYHRLWREVRDANKYARMIAFGEALPAIRSQVDADLRRSGLPRERVLAATVRLLDETLIRVGNQEYARENESFGLTTLQDEHVEVDGTRLRFRFRGKAGVEHEIDVRDPRLARIVKRSQDLPGEELFQYLDDGEQRAIESSDVNAYLREVTEQDFTAKDFRTWGGTVEAARALVSLGRAETQRERTQLVKQAIEEVARHLGNTPTVARASYVDPRVVDLYHHGTVIDLPDAGGDIVTDEKARAQAEQAVLELLDD
jgi:DNA topoisomerase-1